MAQKEKDENSSDGHLQAVPHGQRFTSANGHSPRNDHATKCQVSQNS